PVCGSPLDEVPRRPGDRVLKAAAAKADAAERSATRAASAARRAERDLEAATRDIDEAARMRERTEKDGAEASAALEAARSELAAPVLPKSPPSGAAGDALAEHAAQLAEAFAGFASQLDERGTARHADEERLFGEARAAAGDSVEDAEDLPSLASSLHGEIKD